MTMKNLITVLFLALLISSCGIDDAVKNCEAGIILATDEVGDIDSTTPCPAEEACSLRDALAAALNLVCEEEGSTVIVQLPQEVIYEIREGKQVGNTWNDEQILAAFDMNVGAFGQSPKIIIEGNGSTIKLSEALGPNKPHHLFFINDNANVEFRNLRFEMGDIVYPDWQADGAGDPEMDYCGGAIHNNGLLTVDQCTFHDCRAQLGGAIFNLKRAEIRNSVFSENIGMGRLLTTGGGNVSEGGALCNWGWMSNMIVEDCEFIDNVADFGSAIYNLGNCTVDVRGSNFSFNTCNNPDGATIYNDFGTMDVRNTVLKNETPWAIDTEGSFYMYDSKIWQDIDMFGDGYGAIKAKTSASFENVEVSHYRCENDDCPTLIVASGTVNFDNCSIFNNRVPALMTKAGPVFNMEGCHIANNIVDVNIIANAPRVRFVNNEIINNSATGLILANTENLEFNNNIFADNRSESLAGALSMTSNVNVTAEFIHNTIYNNEVESSLDATELNLDVNFGSLIMHNNIIHNKNNGNRYITNMELSGSGGLSFGDNYLNTTESILIGQEFISDDILIGDITEFASTALIRVFDLHPPVSLIGVAPIVPEVTKDKNGADRGPSGSTPGALEI